LWVPRTQFEFYRSSHLRCSESYTRREQITLLGASAYVVSRVRDYQIKSNLATVGPAASRAVYAAIA
jgi:hypothetical protein